MNDPLDETTAGAEGMPPGCRTRALGKAGCLVDTRVGVLQRRLLGGGSDASVRATLASLRRGVSREPGELPEIWELTAVPDTSEQVGDAPTWDEVAVHMAMTLYALHQQSKVVPMDRRGVGLGRAAHDVVGRGDEENSSARARFNALVTSSTVSELRHHLRSFIALLRSKGIPLDHAMLADDIAQFQRPGGAKTVQLRWSRQYYAVPTSQHVSEDLRQSSTAPINHAATSEES